MRYFIPQNLIRLYLNKYYALKMVGARPRELVCASGRASIPRAHLSWVPNQVFLPQSSAVRGVSSFG